MTCIVGMISNNSVTLGADSAGVSGLDVVIRKDPKIFKVGEFVIGCTSSFRMIQLLRFSLKLPDIGSKDVYEYMCTDFINSVRKTFKKGGYLQKDSAGDERGGIFLVGIRGRLFKISGDFQVGESVDTFEAIGSGEDYAKGSLYDTCPSRNPSKFLTEDRIIRALETAEKFNAGVVAPFVLETT